MKERTFPCPSCKTKTSWNNNPFRPFCSERCRLADLGKWAAEEYRIPGEKKDVTGSADDAQEGRQ